MTLKQGCASFFPCCRLLRVRLGSYISDVCENAPKAGFWHVDFYIALETAHSVIVPSISSTHCTIIWHRTTARLQWSFNRIRCDGWNGATEWEEALTNIWGSFNFDAFSSWICSFLWYVSLLLLCVCMTHVLAMWPVNAMIHVQISRQVKTKRDQWCVYHIYSCRFHVIGWISNTVDRFQSLQKVVGSKIHTHNQQQRAVYTWFFVFLSPFGVPHDS